jgi:hypothetical protein
MNQECARANKLDAENGKLGGHANQKQKIRHLEKLAEEKNQLKADKARLQRQLDAATLENRRLVADLAKISPNATFENRHARKAAAKSQKSIDSRPSGRGLTRKHIRMI